MSYLKNRIKTNSTELAIIIFSEFYRSLLIYYITPLYEAGAINQYDIDTLETQLVLE